MTSANPTITLPAFGEKRPERSPRRRSGQTELVIGGEPRVDLLPPEVLVETRERVGRRAVVWIAIGVLVLALAATALAYLYQQREQNALTKLQAQNSSVLAEQQKYAKVRTVQGEVDQTATAQYLGTATEVDWKSYLTQIGLQLPDGASITAVNAQTGTLGQPLADAAGSALTGPYAASIAVTVTAPSQDAVAQFMDDLAELPGFVSAAPGAISQQANAISTTVTIDLSEAAYSRRFASSK